MNQLEKNQISLEKIRIAACSEFNEKGYHGASLNSLLANHHISKGMLYHYFKNRDDLYLFCVKACFNDLHLALNTLSKDGDSYLLLQTYFEKRSQFFIHHPEYQRIFLDTCIYQPKHLLKSLDELRQPFQLFNKNMIKQIIEGLPLQAFISKEDALQQFALIQNAFHFQLMMKYQAGETISIIEYEQSLHKSIRILLFGLVEGEML